MVLGYPSRLLRSVAKDGSIIVEDSGPGLGNLDPDEMQQPFRKGSTTSDGAGLGLAIVRHVAELHGGRLEIGRSTLGGARFVMSLPSRDSARDLSREPVT